MRKKEKGWYMAVGRHQWIDLQRLRGEFMGYLMGLMMVRLTFDNDGHKRRCSIGVVGCRVYLAQYRPRCAAAEDFLMRAIWILDRTKTISDEK